MNLWNGLGSLSDNVAAYPNVVMGLPGLCLHRLGARLRSYSQRTLPLSYIYYPAHELEIILPQPQGAQVTGEHLIKLCLLSLMRFYLPYLKHISGVWGLNSGPSFPLKIIPDPLKEFLILAKLPRRGSSILPQPPRVLG